MIRGGQGRSPESMLDDAAAIAWVAVLAAAVLFLCGVAS